MTKEGVQHDLWEYAVAEKWLKSNKTWLFQRLKTDSFTTIRVDWSMF